ncbi:MAG: M3 family oligoendopeptidase [Armatimonadota bacterium]
MASTLPPTHLPTWDLQFFYSSFDSAEHLAARQDLEAQLTVLEAQLDQEGIDGGDALPADATQAHRARSLVDRLNHLMTNMTPMRAYAYGRLTTDAGDEEAQAAIGYLTKQGIRASKIETRFTAWLGRFDVAQLVAHDAVLQDHAFALHKRATEAKHQMTMAEEALAADMGETGGSAWSRLYGNFSSQIEVVVNGESMPMSAVRNLAYDSDPNVRKAGYEAELAAWSRNEIPIAAAINAIKGETLLLAKRRGWGHPLEYVLFDNHMDRASLDAMMSAAQKSFPDWRRYLRAKAKALGHEGGLPWYDMFAPLGEERSYEYAEAEHFVEDMFRRYSDKMGDLARTSYDERWTDAGPKRGKRDGAFCMSAGQGKSRILMNFKPAFGSVATLAHELGHAYHNQCLAIRQPLQRDTPMPLAETASIFCETIIKRAALQETEGAAKVAILEASLQGACQVVVDITSRYRFEESVFAGRAERDLSPRELCDAMRAAQDSTYGDGLSCSHPYMWAVKPHYYSYGAYYNFPYMFGLLFALGLYDVYTQDPDAFRDRYDDLLASTGMFDAATLAQRFGIDIRDEAFWQRSLGVLVEDIDEFEQLVTNG